jgi:hypothetical protein
MTSSESESQERAAAVASRSGADGSTGDALVLLTLIAPRALEETIVDWLLEHGHEGFTSFDCSGHGVSAAQLSVSEQVSGREARVGFWLAVESGEADRIVREMGRAPMASVLRFWMAPLLAGGRVPLARDAEGASPDK